MVRYFVQSTIALRWAAGVSPLSARTIVPLCAYPAARSSIGPELYWSTTVPASCSLRWMITIVLSPPASIATARSLAFLATVSRSAGASLTVKPVLLPAVFRHPTTSSLVGVPFAAPPLANDAPPSSSSLPPPQPATATATIAPVQQARFTMKVMGGCSQTLL